MLLPQTYMIKPAFGTPINPYHPLSQGLVGYWLMNGASGLTAYDLSGFGNHGTFGAGAAAPSWKPQGIYYDGGDHINCGTENSLNMGAGNFTIGTRFKTSAYGTLTGKGSTYTGGKRYYIGMYSGGGIFISIDDNVASKTLISTLNYDDNIWHFAVGVRDGNNLRLYIDGIEDPNSPLDITGVGSTDSPRAYYIGAIWREDTGVINEHFTGNIGNAWVYNRALLSQEVSQLCVNSYVMFAQPMEFLYAPSIEYGRLVYGGLVNDGLVHGRLVA